MKHRFLALIIVALLIAPMIANAAKTEKFSYEQLPLERLYFYENHEAFARGYGNGVRFYNLPDGRKLVIAEIEYRNDSSGNVTMLASDLAIVETNELKTNAVIGGYGLDWMLFREKSEEYWENNPTEKKLVKDGDFAPASEGYNIVYKPKEVKKLHYIKIMDIKDVSRYSAVLISIVNMR